MLRLEDDEQYKSLQALETQTRSIEMNLEKSLNDPQEFSQAIDKLIAESSTLFGELKRTGFDYPAGPNANATPAKLNDYLREVEFCGFSWDQKRLVLRNTFFYLETILKKVNKIGEEDKAQFISIIDKLKGAMNENKDMRSTYDKATITCQPKRNEVKEQIRNAELKALAENRYVDVRYELYKSIHNQIKDSVHLKSLQDHNEKNAHKQVFIPAYEDAIKRADNLDKLIKVVKEDVAFSEPVNTGSKQKSSLSNRTEKHSFNLFFEIKTKLKKNLSSLRNELEGMINKYLSEYNNKDDSVSRRRTKK
jgi:hypothetical protein